MRSNLAKALPKGVQPLLSTNNVGDGSAAVGGGPKLESNSRLFSRKKLILAESKCGGSRFGLETALCCMMITCPLSNLLTSIGARPSSGYLHSSSLRLHPEQTGRFSSQRTLRRRQEKHPFRVFWWNFFFLLSSPVLALNGDDFDVLLIYESHC